MTDWEAALKELRDFHPSTYLGALRASEVEGHIQALTEEIDLLRARAPRKFILARKSEWVRLFREVHGYLRTCHSKHGTDWAGRNHAMDALIEAMKFMEADDAARETTLATLREAEARARASADVGDRLVSAHNRHVAQRLREKAAALRLDAYHEDGGVGEASRRAEERAKQLEQEADAAEQVHDLKAADANKFSTGEG